MQQIKIEDVRRKLRNGDYYAKRETVPKALPKSHVEDENESVVWNRQFLEQRERDRLEVIKRNRNSENEACARLRNDTEQALVNEYGMTARQAGIVWSAAYESGHSDGYEQVISDAVELAEFWTDMMAEDDGA